MQTTKSTCCYCGVGCGVLISTEAGRIVDVKGDPEHPANFGRLCTKGSTLHLSARPDARLLQPMTRSDRSAAFAPAAWDATLDELARRFADTIREHGPDSVAFYISGQLLTEDYYVFNKLAKGLENDPPLMLVGEPDAQARWYYEMKKQWRAAQEQGTEFRNPLKAETLHWVT